MDIDVYVQKQKQQQQNEHGVVLTPRTSTVNNSLLDEELEISNDSIQQEYIEGRFMCSM